MADISRYNFSGKLSFKEPVTNRGLANMFPKNIGGDQGDVIDFTIDDEGDFSGTLASYHDDLDSDDVQNILISVLIIFDENTNKIIDKFTELNT